MFKGKNIALYKMPEFKDDSAQAAESDNEHEELISSRHSIIEAYEQQLLDKLDEAYAKGFEQGQKKGHEEGYAQGFAQAQQEGFAQGLREGLATREEELRQALKLVESLKASIHELEENIGQSVIRFSLEVASSIVQKDIEQDPTYLSRLIQSAINSSSAKSGFVIVVNPEDERLLTETQELNKRFLELDCTIQTDPRIERGACFIRSEAGEVDASLSTRWRNALASVGGFAQALSVTKP